MHQGLKPPVCSRSARGVVHLVNRVKKLWDVIVGNRFQSPLSSGGINQAVTSLWCVSLQLQYLARWKTAIMTWERCDATLLCVGLCTASFTSRSTHSVLAVWRKSVGVAMCNVTGSRVNISACSLSHRCPGRRLVLCLFNAQ